LKNELKKTKISIMKRHALSLLLILGFISSVFAQNVPGEKMVPQPVKTKFKAEYPNSVLKRWEIKAGVKEYVAVFTDNNLAKRARYKADGTPVFLTVHHPSSVVPTAVSAKVLAEYSGFKVDWANEWKNFVNGNHVIEIHLSKPGYVLKAFVKPDGSVITDEKKIKEAGEEVQTDPANGK
jgi:hypothetical protein